MRDRLRFLVISVIIILGIFIFYFILGVGCHDSLKQPGAESLCIYEIYQQGTKIHELCYLCNMGSFAKDVVYYKRTNRRCNLHESDKKFY